MPTTSFGCEGSPYSGLTGIVGHKTLAMTQRYSHLAHEQLQNTVKRLDRVIGERRELVGEVS